MNKSDGERIAGLLDESGWKKCLAEEDADLIIVVACSVRQMAFDRVFGRAVKYEKLKKKNKNLKTFLTGCVLDIDKKKLEGKFDVICNIKEISQFLNFLISNPGLMQDNDHDNYDYLKIKPAYQSKFQAYIPIMTGCHNFCSYCVVPYTRGREYSRPAKDILNEVKKLIKNGYKEIFLLGQNVNSYSAKNLPLSPSSCLRRQAKEGELNFPDLLRLINSIKGDFWIRFATSHPKDMSDDLIDAIAECEKVCPYIHLPIQAGSDKILEAMNRKYTKEHYLTLIEKIKKKIPDIMLSTDIIVGFPGERKKDFLETADVMRKVKYTMAYIARYSPRAGTVAYKLKDDVSREEKARREEILTEILKKTAIENNKKFVGRTVRALVERQIPLAASAGEILPGYFCCIGKTSQFTNVRIKGRILKKPPQSFERDCGGEAGKIINANQHEMRNENARKKRTAIAGQFADVKIISADSWGMEGEFIKFT